MCVVFACWADCCSSSAVAEFLDGHTQATQQEARTWKQTWQVCRTRATSCQLITLHCRQELLLWKNNRNSGLRPPRLDLNIVLKSRVFTQDWSISASVTDWWQLMQTNRPADKRTWQLCQAVGDDWFLWSHSLTLCKFISCCSSVCLPPSILPSLLLSGCSRPSAYRL